MLFGNKWNKRTTFFSLAIGLVMIIVLGIVSPALAQEIVFQKIQAAYQDDVEVRTGSGEVLGSGTFQATISRNPNGRIDGRAELFMDGLAVELTFPSLDSIIFENGFPVGVVLNSRGTVTVSGQIKTFTAPVTVRIGGTTTIPDCLLWDIPGPAVDFPNGLNFDVQGTLQFEE